MRLTCKAPGRTPGFRRVSGARSRGCGFPAGKRSHTFRQDSECQGTCRSRNRRTSPWETANLVSYTGVAAHARTRPTAANIQALRLAAKTKAAVEEEVKRQAFRYSPSDEGRMNVVDALQQVADFIHEHCSNLPTFKLFQLLLTENSR